MAAQSLQLLLEVLTGLLGLRQAHLQSLLPRRRHGSLREDEKESILTRSAATPWYQIPLEISMRFGFE